MGVAPLTVILHQAVIVCLWDKAWRESEDTENVYVDRMRLMQVGWRGALEDVHLCRGRLGKYLIR
jgi:hypothetical protein